MDRDLLPNSKLPFKIASNHHGIVILDASNLPVVNCHGGSPTSG